MKDNKKSQAWGIDLFVGTVIFIIGIVTFYLYLLNSPDDSNEYFERLTYDGKVVSSSILSEGYPRDWNTIDVVNIGILKGNKIDDRKLRDFYQMTRTNEGYIRTRSLLNTKFDYYFFLEEPMVIEGVAPPVDGIGRPGFNRTYFNATNIMKTTRLVIYHNNAMSAYLYIIDD